VLTCNNGNSFEVFECEDPKCLSSLLFMLKFHCRDRTETYITIEKYGNTMCLGKTSEADVKHPINTCFKIGATAYGASFSGSCSNSTNGFPITSKAIIERYE
jgi:hypothetical protein